MSSPAQGKMVWKFCARVPVSDDEDEREAESMENPLRDQSAAANTVVRRAPAAEKAKVTKTKNTGAPSIDVQYTNTGAMDITFASDSDTGQCWVKDVTSSKVRPGMRLVAIEVLNIQTQQMVTRSVQGVPFNEVIKELEMQTSIGQQGISPYHMVFEPDLEDSAVANLKSTKFLRLESNHTKEVIDAIEAIDRGTERSAALAVYKTAEYEQQRAMLAFAVANTTKLQKRIDALEKERERTEQQHEEQLRRVTALEREEAAAAQEGQSQLREMEGALAKVNQDLKSMQTQHDDLGKEFATQSGQLEAARKREMQAHESQAQLARHLMDTLDRVDDEEEELAESIGQVRQLVQQIENLKAQKAADDEELELKTVQLREAAAATRQAGQREENTRTELEAKIQKLNSTIAGLNAKSDRQQENQKMERATVAAQIETLEEGRRRLESTLAESETKYSLLLAQNKEMQTTLTFSTREIQGLKKQREDIQAALSTQLKEQDEERAKAEKEVAQIQKTVDRKAAQLEKQQKLAARDIKLAKDTDRFEQNQLVDSISDKIKQITAFRKQVSQLQNQLDLEKQARAEHESEVARLNEDVVSEAKEVVAMKVQSESLKTTIATKNDLLQQCGVEKTRMESTIADLRAQMQAQADNLQSELDDERKRANESEEMRADVETKLQSVAQELLRVQRALDDLKAQHNTTLTQIATLERRSQMQNLAAKTVATLAHDRLADVTQSHSMDAVTIEKLKVDYQVLHGMMEKSGRELDETRHVLDSHVKHIEVLTEQAADSKTANEKTISELQAKLATARDYEKYMSAKVATLGQDVTQLTGQSQKEALTARSALSKMRDMKAVLDRKQNELGKARERIRELDSVQQAAQASVHDYLQQLHTLEEDLKLEKASRRNCEQQLATSIEALTTATGQSEILEAQLAQANTQLSVASAVQPVLDETKRKLTATTAELEESKAIAAAEHARALDSLRSELTETKQSMESALQQARDALAAAEGDIADLQASKTKLAAELAADEEALESSGAQNSAQSAQVKALSQQIAETEKLLTKEKAARATDAEASAAVLTRAQQAAKLEAAKVDQAAEAAKAAAKKQADSQAVALQQEAQNMSEALALAKAALDDANKTIAVRDTELKVQAEKAAADAADADKARKDVEEVGQKTAAEHKKKIDELEGAAQAAKERLNTSEAELSSTKGLLQAEIEAKDRLQEAVDELSEKITQEEASHNETKDLSRAQLEDAKLTIDRYAKEAVSHKAENDGLQDKLKDMERERMRIYGRLAETQMVLLSKNSALVESIAQSKRYRAMATLKIGMVKSAQAQMQAAAGEEAKNLQEQLALAEAEVLKSSQELEQDRQRTENELRETTEAYLQAQRVNEDQERQIATLQSTIDATTAKVAKLEQDVKTLDEQCALWRAKVRHRHRALQMPQFAKSKKGQKEKEQWMKQKALDDSLGFDDTLNQDVTVSFDGTTEYEQQHNGSLGLGLISCKDRENRKHTLIHHMAEGSTSDKCPQLVNGQVLVTINGESLEGLNVAQVCDRLKAASRPVELMLRPGSMELKLIAYEDHTHDVPKGGKKTKKNKKK